MMITINLLPEELKVKPKAEGSAFKFTLQEKYFVYLLPVVICVLIFVHIVLILFSAVKGAQLSVLSKKWLSLGPQRKELDVFERFARGALECGGAGTLC